MDRQFVCFNRKSLETLLPHRGSALGKIDGVFIERGIRETAIGLKEVRIDDPDLEGHFPGSPTYPGYAQDEFVCLVAAALLIYCRSGVKTNPHVVQKSARYRKNVLPGDRLTAEVNLLATRAKFNVFSATVKNQNGVIVAEYDKIIGSL